jgi:hypothetical protein
VEGGVASGDGGRPPPRRRRPRGFGEFAVGGVVGGDGEFGDELPLDAYLLSTTENIKSVFEIFFHIYYLSSYFSRFALPQVDGYACQLYFKTFTFYTEN